MAAALTVALLLLITDTALSVWQQLATLPAWMQVAYGMLVLALALGVMALAWRWLRPRRPAATPEHQPAALDAESLERYIAKSASEGVDVGPAIDELRERRHRQASGAVYIALFGEVSTGKSSLVKALIPAADPDIDVRAGSTRASQYHEWQADSGDHIIMVDLPGFNLESDTAVLEEARRAHLVVFLCEGDLTRSQFEQLAGLQELQKPLVLAINKADRFSTSELEQFRDRIGERAGLPPEDICAISCGGREEIIRVLAGGHESVEGRARAANVDALRKRLQFHLDRNRDLMTSLRDTAVLMLASEKLQSAREAHRRQQSDLLVRTYSRRAMVGALAAVAPGSDLVIQGALATRLVQELCGLYEVSIKEVQIESFLKLAGGRVRKMSALTLAIAGNALKAFPGLGTISGGLLHAAAYGMIFDSLGRAAADTLASRGELRPLPAARAFEDNMSEHLATGAERFARLALQEQDDEDSARAASSRRPS